MENAFQQALSGVHVVAENADAVLYAGVLSCCAA
jgi:hypothetical protein